MLEYLVLGLLALVVVESLLLIKCMRDVKQNKINIGTIHWFIEDRIADAYASEKDIKEMKKTLSLLIDDGK